ncbi:MAG: zinc ribbon domain-containing protein, partial [Defluviitaleaceae bacterium]|nr:zinc ribbon domain-containing protein [Defluviitaleaceae bacterium]
MNTRTSAPGRGLLIAAGVLLIITGILGLIEAWAIFELSRNPWLALGAEMLLGIPLGLHAFIGFVSSGLWVAVAIEAFVFNNRAEKAATLQNHVIAIIIVYAIYTLTRGGFSALFSILFLIANIGPILCLVGTNMNKGAEVGVINASAGSNAVSNKAKCSKCLLAYSKIYKSCPHCGQPGDLLNVIAPATAAPPTPSGKTCPCGQICKEDATFCGKCGNPFHKKCACGQISETGMDFCSSCGKQISKI